MRWEIDVHLYGKLRRFTEDTNPRWDAVLSMEVEEGETISDIIRRIGARAPFEYAEEILKWGVTPTVYTLKGAVGLSETAEAVGEVAAVHVKVDTGLGRIGFLTGDASLDAIEKIAQLPSLEIEGVFTHFALARATLY